MKPTITGLPAASEALAISSAPAAVAAGGFSMNTGSPVSSAASVAMRCSSGPTAMPMASSPGVLIISRKSSCRAVTPYSAAVAFRAAPSRSQSAAMRMSLRPSCGSSIWRA